jgi:CHAD domain-containing protein
MFVGTQDDLGDVTDAQWARDQLNSSVMVHYQEVDAGHSTFMIGKDMTYFDQVMDLVHQYNPLPKTLEEEM